MLKYYKCVIIISRYPIFSLGFGDGADIDFLKKLSLNNTGFARVIYEASDASLQLRNFYKEISSPVLSNVTFKYIDTQVQIYLIFYICVIFKFHVQSELFYVYNLLLRCTGGQHYRDEKIIQLVI